MAQKLEELPVYMKARLSALQLLRSSPARRLAKPQVTRQLADANESILANMEEGFEQSTDAALANYLYTSKGSIAEVVVRLKGAERRGWLTRAEYAHCATWAPRSSECSAAGSSI